jgi:hypothetical protein
MKFTSILILLVAIFTAYAYGQSQGFLAEAPRVLAEDDVTQVVNLLLQAVSSLLLNKAGNNQVTLNEVLTTLIAALSNFISP